MDLSVVIPAKGEGPNLGALLPALRKATDALGLQAEILVITPGADPFGESVARDAGARVLQQATPGYGGALRCGFEAADADWILTMDADQSHQPGFIADMWSARDRADLVVASRYVPGGRAIMPFGRYVLSRVLNLVYSRGLGVPVADMSSGFRLYRKRRLPDLRSLPENFDALQTLLVQAYTDGWQVIEVPFTYQPRGHGRSTARLFRFGLDSARTYFRLLRMRRADRIRRLEHRSTR
jgi:dolichol-phosphate mannosyltransferase